MAEPTDAPREGAEPPEAVSTPAISTPAISTPPASTPPVLPPRGARARDGRQAGSGPGPLVPGRFAVGRLVPLVVGVLLVALGWWQDQTVSYLAGVALAAAGVLWALRSRRTVASIAAAAVAITGIAGPWLGSLWAYRDAGVAVDAAFVEVSAVEGDDGVLWVRNDAEALAVLPDGHIAARVAHGGGELGVLPDNWLLVQGGRDIDAAGLGVFDDEGTLVWSVDAPPDPGSSQRVIAHADGVLVEQRCERTEVCSWTGRRVSDGTEVWSIDEGSYDGASYWQRMVAQGVPEPWLDLDAPWFVVGAPEAAWELRAAGSGEVVHGTEPGHWLWVLGDLALEADADRCAIGIVGPDGVRGLPDNPCLSSEEPGVGYIDSSAGRGHLMRTGETIVVRGTHSGTWELDTADGAMAESDRQILAGRVDVADREEGQRTSLSDGEVRVDVDSDRVVARSAATGEELWSRDVDVDRHASAWLGDGVLMITQEARPFPLERWFAPTREPAHTLSLYDVHTGDLLDRTRFAVVPGREHVHLVGDRVLLGRIDDGGRFDGRILGG